MDYEVLWNIRSEGLVLSVLRKKIHMGRVEMYGDRNRSIECLKVEEDKE